MEKNYENQKPITYIARTNWRSQNKRFGIKAADRWQHIYSVGKSGSGKSTLLFNMAQQDILNGNGLAILDPHGDVAERLKEIVPIERFNDLVYLNAADLSYPIGFNPIDQRLKVQPHLLASEIVSIFKKMFGDSWGVRLEYILRYSVLTLIHAPNTTLLDIQPLLLDKEYREGLLSEISDQAICSFWRDEYDRYTPSFRNEAISSILNKSGAFISNETIRNIIGNRNNSFSLGEIISEGKILIVNLSKGLIGEQACALLGSMLTSGIQMAAMRQAHIPYAERKPFYYYIDEAHVFIASKSFCEMLSECRKYKLGLFITHQYLDQMPDDIRNAIIGNVGTLIVFRLGTKDARALQDEFYPYFDKEDIIELPRFHIYIKLLIDGIASKAFSAVVDNSQ